MNTSGRHITADVWCSELPEHSHMLVIGTRAIEASGMRIVESVSRKFDPQGTTAVWILAESHMTLHTWPEEGYVSVDVYTCGQEGNPLTAIAQLLSMLDPHRAELRFMSRGGVERGEKKVLCGFKARG